MSRTDDAARVSATGIAVYLRGIIAATANIVRALPRADELTHHACEFECN